MTPLSTTGPVLIVGTGLLGASVGLGLATRGVEVLLSDPSPTALGLAVDVGAGRAMTADDEPTLVVVAAPPDVAAQVVVAQLVAHPNAVVTDVTSVKSSVLAAVGAAGADLRRYVGSHPMAGRERSGPAAALPDLFIGRPWVLVGSHADPAARRVVRGLAIDLGAMPVEMDADEHDHAVALVSHVPQLAASLVAGLLVEADGRALGLAGQGLRDVTRIAASDPGMWTAILAANASSVHGVLVSLRERLDAVVAALEPADDLDALAVAAGEAAPTAPGEPQPGSLVTIARTISAGNDGVRQIPGKHGGAPTAFESVTVLVPDTPGSLARLLTDVGEIGVNLEDLTLEHSAGRPVGMAQIWVMPGRAAVLGTELTARGWKIVR